MGGHKRHQIKGIDYNVEIPFEKEPAPGFYNTYEEHVEKIEYNFNEIRQQDSDDGIRMEKEAVSDDIQLKFRNSRKSV